MDQHRRGAGLAPEAERGARPTALLVADASEPHLLCDDPFVDAGLSFTRATGLEAAQAAFDRHRPDLVFLPVAVQGQSSRQLLERLLARQAQPVVVVIASNDQINAAAEAMRHGAFDCLFRPFSVQRLAKTLAAAIAALPRRDRTGTAAIARPAAPTRTSAPPDAPLGGAAPIFVSPRMHAQMSRIDAVAQSDTPVFLTGEAGTGKTLLAGVLHERSRRGDGPLVRVDCAALTPARFGHDLAGRDGAHARAARGTLFLDEIADLDPALQPRLIALIDEAISADRGGEDRPRLVASTRHDARALLRAGRLRPELFFRLHVAPIALPPLRARSGDVRAIAEAALATFSRREGRRFTRFREDTLQRLDAYDWPGNVRELINTIWSVVVLHEGAEVTLDMLPATLEAPLAPGAGQIPGGLSELVGKTLEEIEELVVEATIQAEGGSIPRAARVLGVSPSTIYRKREAWARRNRR